MWYVILIHGQFNFMNNLTKVITTVAAATMFVCCINVTKSTPFIVYCNEERAFQLYNEGVSVLQGYLSTRTKVLYRTSVPGGCFSPAVRASHFYDGTLVHAYSASILLH